MEQVRKIGVFRPVFGFISKTAQDTVLVTMEDKQELVCDLSNGAIFSDLGSCRQKIKTRFSHKLSNLELSSLLTTYRK